MLFTILNLCFLSWVLASIAASIAGIIITITEIPAISHRFAIAAKVRDKVWDYCCLTATNAAIAFYACVILVALIGGGTNAR